MAHPLHDQIRAIARQARWLLVWHGLGWFVAVALSVAFALGLADYLLRFQDRGVRIISSLALIGVVLESFRRFVYPAWRRHFTEIEVAQQIERRFPQLGNRLSSAIEFLRVDVAADYAGSPALQRAVVAETESLVRPLDVTECLDRQATRRSLRVAIPLLLIVGGVCLLDLDSAARAARRMAIPWSSETWPRRHSLEFVTPPPRLAAGQDFIVELVDRHGQLPEHADIQFWVEGDAPEEIESQPLTRVDDRLVYRRESVTRSFKYRARGGDDDTMDWLTLEVVEPARVEDFSVRVQPPTYSGIAPSEISGGTIRVLESSDIQMTGRVTRPVVAVTFHLQLGEDVRSIEAALDTDGQGFTLSNLPTDLPGTGQYWLALVEADGVVSGQDTRQDWQIVPDLPPSLTWKQPSEDMVYTPSGLVSLEVAASDDLALQRVELRFEDKSIPLFVGGDEPPARLDWPNDAEQRELMHVLDLSTLQLEPNDAIELRCVARDYKQQESPLIRRVISVISAEEFEYRLQDRQKLLLQRLVEALRLQRATRSQTDSLRNPGDKPASPSAATVGLLQASELQQRQVERLLADQHGGAQQMIDSLLASLASNQVSGHESQDRLQLLARSLEQINREWLPTIFSDLSRTARLFKGDTAELSGVEPLLASVARGQDAMIESLQAMIDQLAQWDDYRRFARDVARLLHEQQDVSAAARSLTTFGRRLDDLSELERGELQRVSEQQVELARRFERLAGEMQALSGQLSDTDPLASATLGAALRAARERAVADRMRQGGTEVARNQLGNAVRSQSEAESGLTRVLGELTASGPSNVARRVEELERTADELAELHQRQTAARAQLERLADQEAAQRDPAAMSSAATQQQQIAADGESLASRLDRLQAASAAAAAKSGAEAAAQAASAGEQADANSAASAANASEANLNEARQRLAEEIQQAKKQQQTQTLALLEREVTQLAKRQRSLLEATEQSRSAEPPPAWPQWTSQQTELAQDTRSLQEQLSLPKVFSVGLASAEAWMRQAAQRLRDQPPDADVERLQRRAWTQLLQLLMAQKASSAETQDSPPQSPGEPDPASESPAQVNLEELRLLHLMQVAINERTLGLEREGQGELTPDNQQELAQLAAEQIQLAELVAELLSGSRPEEPKPAPSTDRELERELDRALERILLPDLGDAE